MKLHFTIGRRSMAGWVYQSFAVKALEEENRQLKQLVADLSLDKQMLQDVLKKSSNSHSATTGYRSEGLAA